MAETNFQNYFSNSNNGEGKSTNSNSSESRLRDICNGRLPLSLCDTIGKVVKNKGIEIAGNPKAIMKPMLKFDSNGKVVGGSINITVRF